MGKCVNCFIQKLFLVFLSCISFPVLATNAVIDVLVVYTQGTADLYGGDPTTRINQIFQVTNQIYADSGVNLEVRLAGLLKVNYTDDNSAETALQDITYNRVAAFNGVNAAREEYKADMVILYRPYKNSHGSCGVAWVGGQGTNGNFPSAQYKGFMYSHIAINSCGDYVTAHELGHNMGLKHSRKQDGTGGTFHYALGYGVVNLFTDIMAYQSEFNVDYWDGKLYKFSNPEITCKGVPCGVDRNNTTSGADARHALNVTGPQIANFYVGASASSSSAASSVQSSSRSSSVSSVAQSSSSSSLSIIELEAAVAQAKTNYDAAVVALAANTKSVADKTKTETAMKTALTSATAKAKTAKTTYDTAVKKYNTSVTLLNTLQTQLNTALAAYNSATTEATKKVKLTAYNALVTKYNTAQTQAVANFNAAMTAQNNLVAANNALVTATNNYNAAKAATAAEKALTAGLKANVSSTLATYKTLQAQLKAAMKAAKTR